MDKTIITFSADDQILKKTEGIDICASNTVSYVEAHFELGDNWSGYDSVRAIWGNESIRTSVATMLDSDGVCIVPHEVLSRKGFVHVNLVGSISENSVVTDRLTTFPIIALAVSEIAKTDGNSTQQITPSQYEQFVAEVRSSAAAAYASAVDAGEYADAAEASAELAEQASANAGYMFFSIDANGHLIYERTSNTQVDFNISNGHLYVEANE